jgi:hypothetical protein
MLDIKRLAPDCLCGHKSKWVSATFSWPFYC